MNINPPPTAPLHAIASHLAELARVLVQADAGNQVPLKELPRLGGDRFTNVKEAKAELAGLVAAYGVPLSEMVGATKFDDQLRLFSICLGRKPQLFSDIAELNDSPLLAVLRPVVYDAYVKMQTNAMLALPEPSAPFETPVAPVHEPAAVEL